MEQPVAVELGNARKHINDADLRPQRPDDPCLNRLCLNRSASGSVQRPVVVGGQQQKQHGSQSDEPVMVEIQARLNQLGVGETHDEKGGGEAMPVAEGDADAEGSQSDHMQMHPRRRQRSDPAEPAVGEMVFGV